MGIIFTANPIECMIDAINEYMQENEIDKIIHIRLVSDQVTDCQLYHNEQNDEFIISFSDEIHFEKVAGYLHILCAEVFDTDCERYVYDEMCAVLLKRFGDKYKKQLIASNELINK